MNRQELRRDVAERNRDLARTAPRSTRIACRPRRSPQRLPRAEPRSPASVNDRHNDAAISATTTLEQPANNAITTAGTTTRPTRTAIAGPAVDRNSTGNEPLEPPCNWRQRRRHPASRDATVNSRLAKPRQLRRWRAATCYPRCSGNDDASRPHRANQSLRNGVQARRFFRWRPRRTPLNHPCALVAFCRPRVFARGFFLASTVLLPCNERGERVQDARGLRTETSEMPQLFALRNAAKQNRSTTARNWAGCSSLG